MPVIMVADVVSLSCRLDERGRLHLPASPVDVIAAAQGDAAARHLREVAKEIRYALVIQG
jgi:hypothetical protein